MIKLRLSHLCPFLLLACSSSPINHARAPASDDVSVITTRDGREVHIPVLRTPLILPPCQGDVLSSSQTGECIPDGEEDLFKVIAKASTDFQGAQNPVGVKVSQRDFHPKQHACLAGIWKPMKNLPEDIAKGAFASASSRRVVVRYSNGNPKSPTGNDAIRPDFFPDARGLAIKLVDMPGESILNLDAEDAPSGTASQDFVLINFPAFFLHGPKAYPEFLTNIRVGKPFFQLLDGAELSNLKATSRPIADLVAETFSSQTPYTLGSQYVKYVARSCNQESVAPISDEEKTQASYLRNRLRQRMSSKDICLIFSVHRKPAEQKVEDAAAIWPSNANDIVDVATIRIPRKQNIDDPVRDSFCENISFNPWNSLPENRPAGAINRARLAVYSAVSRKRRMENGVTVKEPHSADSFFTDVLK